MPCVYLTTNSLNNKKYIGVDSKDDPNYFGSGIIIKNSIKKHGKENFTKIILEQNDNIKYLFEREKYWIEKYNAVESNDFYNISSGGKGGNMLNNPISIEKWEKGIEKTRELTIKLRKNKTYEEIYGDRANEEKEKRRQSLLGKKFTDERRSNISKSLKNKISWNKGLTKETDNRIKTSWNKGLTKETDERVLKYVTSSKINKPKFLKTYTIQYQDTILSFNGRKELKNYIKNINKNLTKGFKISVDNLIINGKDKDCHIVIS